MGIFDRISNVFKSNVNSMLDKVEDPEKILDQNIIDMEKEYTKAKESIARAKAEEIGLNKRIAYLKQEMEKWTNNAKLALGKGNEELAKKALAKKQGYEQELNAIVGDRDSIEKNVEELLGSLKMMENKISEAKRKKDLLKMRLQTAKAKKKIVETKAKIGGIGEGAFDSFNKMEEKANKMINEADALEQINNSLAEEDVDEEFKQLETSGNVESDLEKMKKELGM
ncbi:PspA/IM30 family protein [Haliovirga abyssi]|uniref:Membrane protein n=1 Tax=Haliovirga abyssi TaxID=2996794 RepID=A0AAU9DMX9_9FUSO|nr:PspA/IM30 family protein [Haliovirga abyssi]BDU49678.1 membrane protein [Haliovirga abyssi]